MPTLKQARKIFWKPLLNVLTNHPLVKSINKSELSIQLIGDRPEILVLGVNDQDGDRLRGLRIAGFLGDEMQDVKRGIIDEVIIPAMGDTPNSFALFTGTPKGKVNNLYDLDMRSRQFEDWRSFHFFATDNPHLSRAEIERARQTLPPRVFRQEYEASYEDFPGKIFDQLEERHLVTYRPETFERTAIGIDWGDTNAAMVICGKRDNKWWLVDSWQNLSGETILEDEFLAEALRMVQFWGCSRGYADPSRPASILKWRSHLEPLGCSLFEAFNGISEGNQTINNLLYQNRLFVADERVWDELNSYHRKQDRDGTILDKVADGQMDHRCDSLRYLIATEEYEPPATLDWFGVV
jgi:hypothetical protein